MPWIAPRLYSKTNPVSLAFSFSLILSLNYFHRARSNFRLNLTNLVGLFEREKDFTANSLLLSISFFNFRCFLLVNVLSSFVSVALAFGDESYHSAEPHCRSTPVLEIREEVFRRAFSPAEGPLR